MYIIRFLVMYIFKGMFVVVVIVEDILKFNIFIRGYVYFIVSFFLIVIL